MENNDDEQKDEKFIEILSSLDDLFKHKMELEKIMSECFLNTLKAKFTGINFNIAQDTAINSPPFLSRCKINPVNSYLEYVRNNEASNVITPEVRLRSKNKPQNDPKTSPIVPSHNQILSKISDDFSDVIRLCIEISNLQVDITTKMTDFMDLYPSKTT